MIIQSATVSRKNGIEKPTSNTITTPATAEPKIAPLLPPVALPIMDAVPISKKHVMVNGAITYGKNPVTANNTIAIVDVIMETTNPIINAFGAYGNNNGQSSAGIASGISFSWNPVNAGTISAIIKRTPSNKIVSPAPK